MAAIPKGPWTEGIRARKNAREKLYKKPEVLNSIAREGPGKRIPELDGLRGLAIFMVLVYHLYAAPTVAPRGSFLWYAAGLGKMGWTGVELFFVLSGFLIGGILIDSRRDPGYFRTFYRRRFFRIVPIYSVVVLAVFIFSRFPGRHFAYIFANNPIPWLSFAFFVQNFWMVAHSTLGIALAVTWSLTIEEQFYFTLPLIVRLVNPRKLWIALLVGIAAAPVLRFIGTWFWPGNPLVLMPFLMDSLLLGVVGAVAVRSPEWMQRLTRARLRASMMILGGGLSVMVLSQRRWSTPLGDALGMSDLSFFFLLLLIYPLLHRGWWARSLRVRPLMWLGSIAYGTYLIHQFMAFALAGAIWSSWDPLHHYRGLLVANTFALIITLGLCQLSWLYFEKPLIQFGRSRERRPEPNRNAGLDTLPVAPSS